ncbi:MAG: ATP synthase F1 subunit gamma [Chloroflexi bacterium HGW-Chloroflexi-1]|nr:MAG: ATP synthase F1 subunit gamma [Chloroflexi bacterium HGW-Chloroflexi-1]
MATAREIRRRIRGVRNTAQIAKAMETVAASKMRKAQQQTLASRPYAEKALVVLRSLARQTRSGSDALHPLLEQRPIKSVGLIVYTADRGLCGAFNSNMIRKAVDFVNGQEQPYNLIAVGRKGRDFLMRYGFPVVAEFTGIPDRPTVADLSPIARVAIDDFLAGRWDAVYLAYTSFVNTLVQRPTIMRLLPLEPMWENGTPSSVDYIYEPNPQAILGQVLPRFTELEIYQAMLESIASEQSARMVAMRNARDAATDLIAELTLSYNKARQEAITKELLDIAGGAEALAKARG